MSEKGPRKIDCLVASALLARRWQQVIPDMELTWNPLRPYPIKLDGDGGWDDDSIVFAAQRFLGHVAENLFPVRDWTDDLETVVDSLRTIPILVYGPEYWDMAPTQFELHSLDRVMFTIWMAVDYATDYDDESLMPYADLREFYRLSAPLLSLTQLFTILEQMLESNPNREDAALVLGLARYARYWSVNTGTFFLDRNLYDIENYSFSWDNAEHIAYLTEQGKLTEAFWEPIRSLEGWLSEDDEEHGRFFQLMGIIREASKLFITGDDDRKQVAYAMQLESDYQEFLEREENEKETLDDDEA